MLVQLHITKTTVSSTIMELGNFLLPWLVILGFSSSSGIQVPGDGLSNSTTVSGEANAVFCFSVISRPRASALGLKVKRAKVIRTSLD